MKATLILMLGACLPCSLFAEDAPDVPSVESDAAELRPLAESGDEWAQILLARKYFKGDGVPKNYKEAAKWARKSADQGFDFAQYILGNYYADGVGVPKSPTEAAKWIRKSADQGYAAAQSKLGWMYVEGKGVPKDYAEALKWYRKAVDQGESTAMGGLGNMYMRGQGVTKDEAKAATFFLKAANQGDDAAQCYIGALYSDGIGVPKDEIEAYKWFLLAGAQGNKEAKKMIKLIEPLLTQDNRIEGQGRAREFKPEEKKPANPAPQKEPEQSLTQTIEPISSSNLYEFSTRAEGGDVGSQLALAKFHGGHSLLADEKESTQWYLRAAKQGNAEAQYAVAVNYFMGTGVPVDSAEAYKWMLIAAAQGKKAAKEDVESFEKNLTSLQRTKARVEAREFKPRKEPLTDKLWQDDVPLSAEKLADLRDKAEKGDYESQFLLARAYVQGRDLPRDSEESRKWHRKAADQGYAPAQAALGSIYLLGTDVLKDATEAAKWFRKAADQGYSDGQWALGVLYLTGDGLPSDRSEAYKWFLLAKAQGSEQGQREFDSLEATITELEKADGALRALAFRPQKVR